MWCILMHTLVNWRGLQIAYEPWKAAVPQVGLPAMGPWEATI